MRVRPHHQQRQARHNKFRIVTPVCGVWWCGKGGGGGGGRSVSQQFRQPPEMTKVGGVLFGVVAQ